MGRRARLTTAEPRGTLKRADCALLSTFFYALPRFFSSRPPPSLSQYLTSRWFRNAFHLYEWRHRGGGVWIMGGRAQRTSADPRGTLKRDDCDLKSTFFTRLPAFSPLGPLIAPKT